MADDVGAGFEHDVLVDQARTRDRRPAGVDRGLDAVSARPVDHLFRLVPGLDAAEADLAEQLYAGFAQLLEILLDHALLEDRRAGMDLHAAGRERRETALRGDAERDHALRILRPARQMDLAGGDHRRHAAMHGGIYPAGLVLARRPVAEHRMDMAVDQPGA